jgi:hypothetical protein
MRCQRKTGWGKFYCKEETAPGLRLCYYHNYLYRRSQNSVAGMQYRREYERSPARRQYARERDQQPARAQYKREHKRQRRSLCQA